MSRSFVLIIVLLLALGGAAWYLSTIDTEIETRIIETPVPDNALEG